jgi:hypothetical protein
MAITVASIYTDLIDNLQGRVIAPVLAYEYIRKATLELLEDYQVPLLEQPGPVVTLVVGQPVYSPGYFTIGNAQVNIEKVRSFTIYTNPGILINLGNGSTGAANPCYQMKFKSYDDMQVLLNISGIPTNWTRFNNQIYIGSVPSLPYQVYMGYMQEANFSNPVLATDIIPVENSWQDIIGYCAAERACIALNLNAKASSFHEKVFGDPKFQLTGGTEGQPGLIFRRTSQRERDQTTTMRTMKVRSNGYV